MLSDQYKLRATARQEWCRAHSGKHTSLQLSADSGEGITLEEMVWPRKNKIKFWIWSILSNRFPPLRFEATWEREKEETFYHAVLRSMGLPSAVQCHWAFPMFDEWSPWLSLSLDIFRLSLSARFHSCFEVFLPFLFADQNNFTFLPISCFNISK